METVSEEFPWPCDVLAGILHILALDGASKTFRHLAYMTHNNKDLKLAVKRIPQPLVLRVGFDRDAEDKTFIFPFLQASVAKFKIDWGDGSYNVVTEVGDGFTDHQYAIEGEFIVRVFPLDNSNGCSLDHIGFSTKQMAVDLIRRWWDPLRSFDSLGQLGIKSLSWLFKYANGFNLPLNHLDVSNILDMSHLFCQALAFDQALNSWNVSRVTNMRDMFYSCLAFNQPLHDWNVSCVKDMSGMFWCAAKFNQPIGNWDVSSVIDMASMFEDATSFSQSLKSWDVSNVQNFDRMFDGVP
jgi:surface protein